MFWVVLCCFVCVMDFSFEPTSYTDYIYKHMNNSFPCSTLQYIQQVFMCFCWCLFHTHTHTSLQTWIANNNICFVLFSEIVMLMKCRFYTIRSCVQMIMTKTPESGSFSTIVVSYLLYQIVMWI